MLRSRRIPDFTRKRAVPYHIKCLDRAHPNRISTADERIVLVGPGSRGFWGLLFRMPYVFGGHHECLTELIRSSPSLRDAPSRGDHFTSFPPLSAIRFPS